MNSIVGVIIGLVLGGGVGWFAGRRATRAAPPFAVDEADGVNEPLEAAQAAVADRTEKRFVRIVATAEREGRITNDGVEELFCISDRTASTYLRQLTEAGRLVRRGVGRGTYYTTPSQE